MQLQTARVKKYLLAAALFSSLPALAQERGALNPKPLPPIANPNDPDLPAKDLFGRKTVPADIAARTIGFYSRGCLAGAQALSVDGDAWQVMRLSRNRNWGHPELIAFLESLAREARARKIWPGLLVGDLSQPRGGPMLTGHASHQIGLDADIWLTPMPDERLSRAQREELSATNVVRANGLEVDPAKWTQQHMSLIRLAAQDRRVERIFVNPAIKQAICREAKGDRAWLNKVRPFYGHNYHFHIRLACPASETSCRAQDAIPPGDGCDASLAWWFTDEALNPKPVPPEKRPKPVTLAQLPQECRAVLDAP